MVQNAYRHYLEDLELYDDSGKFDMGNFNENLTQEGDLAIYRTRSNQRYINMLYDVRFYTTNGKVCTF